MILRAVVPKPTECRRQDSEAVESRGMMGLRGDWTATDKAAVRMDFDSQIDIVLRTIGARRGRAARGRP